MRLSTPIKPALPLRLCRLQVRDFATSPSAADSFDPKASADLSRVALPSKRPFKRLQLVREEKPKPKSKEPPIFNPPPLDRTPLKEVLPPMVEPDRPGNLTGLEEAIESLTGFDGRWSLSEDGRALERYYQFPRFLETWSFIERVVNYSKVARHHPEWSNVYTQVFMRLTTHDAIGITLRDTAMAVECDRLAYRYKAFNDGKGDYARLRDLVMKHDPKVRGLAREASPANKLLEGPEGADEELTEEVKDPRSELEQIYAAMAAERKVERPEHKSSFF